MRGPMMEAVASSASQQRKASHLLANDYANLTDEEVTSRVLARHKPSANPVVRSVWVVIGSVFVVFAGIGVLLPGWPTTSWLVAAAYCYGRSSQRLFRWLLTNRLFGSILLGYYRSGKALP
ncbi:MAG: YbaN family protein, partial [Candidatus Thermoplasmatota archaeon]|nr:YbaN family protein [Candidatus Thermoplasmatota archaeon]